MAVCLLLCVVVLQLSRPLQAAGSTPVKCALGSALCKDGSECVKYSHVCDGETDCKDGSDEGDCEVGCNEGQFQCAHGKKCIEQKQVCDGVVQCQDRSDELECTERMEGCAHQCDNNTHCFPKTFLCDGEKDCGDGSDEANCVIADCRDRSDEESCTNPPHCITNQRCPVSLECLVTEWLCDGDQDCKDGTDEQECATPQMECGEFQWACTSNTQCVPKAWRCDAMKDCHDGSDETGCGVATCPLLQFQCGSQECLDMALVCDTITNCADGSDEGAACQTKCPDPALCSQSCYSTPQGTRCGCAAGFRLQEDAVTCVDIDECEGRSPGICSHLCINTPGSYQCQCNPGYIMEADGHHCKITGEPFLLVSVEMELFLQGLHSGRLDVLPSSTSKAILSVDYDWKEQKVFWVNLDLESIRWSSMDQKTKGTLIKGVRADSIAVDWVGRNLYWIDAVSSQIIAIRLATASTPPYSVILDEDLEQPRSLALLPQKGIMFWTETGNEAKIERAGMDGSERRAVVNTSLGWPGGVAVDSLSDRVYWTDERLEAIGSATLDGDDIRILQMREIANPFALAVFNDMLYWSDPKRRSVQAIHKITGKDRRVLLKRPLQPFSIKVIHQQLQKVTESPCERLRCSHLCVLAPGPRAVCKCPSGHLLAEDGLTCSNPVNSAFLLLLSPSTVTQIYLQALHTAVGLKAWPEHLALQVPNVNEADILDYSLREHTLFVTDGGTASLGLFKLKEMGLVFRGQPLKLVGDSFSAMALDWVTLSIYWSGTKQPSLQVTSATGVHTVVLIEEGIGSLESIAVHPPSGRVCFVNLVPQDDGVVSSALVECADMDGAERTVVWKETVQPMSLTFSSNGDEIYWADTSSGSICSIRGDGSGYKELKTEGGLAAFALSDGMLLWVTTSDTAKVWYRDEQQKNKLWFEVSTEVVCLKAYSKWSQSGSNQCTADNGGCHHLCLATPGGRTCKCAHDHVSVNATHCAPEQQCPAGGRLCLDGHTCYPVEKYCHEQPDCPDHSDENCGHLKEGLGTTRPAPSAPPLLPQVPGLSATLNISGQRTHLDSRRRCIQGDCSGHGDCVEGDGDVVCVCSLGYSGDSCQDHLLQTMQGPIIYGAAGLCIGVVIITIVATVIKKRSMANARAKPVGKETSLTDLENKVETVSTSQSVPTLQHVPAAQTVPGGTSVVEEVVSSVD